MLYGGWYVAALSQNGRALALIAGPVQDRAKAEMLLEPAHKVAEGKFTNIAGTRYMPALLAFPDRVPGCENAALWVTPSYVEYNT
jgi:hypothetical protein